MNEHTTPHLFDCYGIELEYAIADSSSGAVRPFADRLLQEAAGPGACEYDGGLIWWSNELARHVIELKNPEPHRSFSELHSHFVAQVARINGILARMDARLMPTGAHPFMNPDAETLLWPDDGNEIYDLYDRIFSCKGHGWSNLQSTHLNLPFANDTEFAALHTAIRLVLPLVPAFCASTPILEGLPTGFMDTRLEYYRNNQIRIPEITGKVIPEPVKSRQDYETTILFPMYQAISPYDPAGLLQHEWLNSRGAIARFERMAIEIRLIDIQECPAADLAVCALIIELLKALVGERWTSQEEQQEVPTESLERLLINCGRHGSAARIGDATYLRHFGLNSTETVTGRTLLEHLVDTFIPPHSQWRQHLELICAQGSLAERIMTSLGKDLSANSIRDVYRHLSTCLSNDISFTVT